MSAEVAVLVSFLLFIGAMFWFRVPNMIGGMLDKRAEGIQSQLDEARAAREEAQTLLAKIERETADSQKEADKIIERARADATRSSEQAKLDLEESIARKLKSAEERIGQVEAAATREVRNAASAAAVAAASEIMGEKIDGSKSGSLIDEGIAKVSSQFH